MTTVIQALFNPFVDFIRELGALATFAAKTLRTAFTTRGNLPAVLDQIASVSFRSLSTVAFAGVFVGAILVLQYNVMLIEYDAQAFLGGLNTSSIVREIGPLIISFLLAGKVGAYTAAELGTMRVTEQIDAIECLGTNPLQFLVVPRYIAILVSSVILLAIGTMISILGSMVIADVFCGINTLQFARSVPQFTSGWTLFSGFFKSAVYGTIVATVSCYRGYTATGGAKGVGKAVTLSAVYINFLIVLSNYVANSFLEMVAEIGHGLFGGLG
ncbi:MAG: MlaE family ABC transporter permease [Bacteriovoracia bacterium]